VAHQTAQLVRGDVWGATASNSVNRGVFRSRQTSKFRDILDGLSSTIAMGEIITDLGVRDIRAAASWKPQSSHEVRDNPSICRNSNEIDPNRPGRWCGEHGNCSEPQLLSHSSHESRGANWANFRSQCSEVYTILPPNREVCVGQWIDAPGTMPPSSHHPGGAHMLMADGAVVFITDSIEAGNSQAGAVALDLPGKRSPGSPSPYGLWGSLGTAAAREVISEPLGQ
jgi:prepilin-type processing-associated H-X9-DG protein